MQLDLWKKERERKGGMGGKGGIEKRRRMDEM